MLKQAQGQKGNTAVGFLVWGLIFWGTYSFFNDDPESTAIMQEHPNYSSYKESKDCSDLEPDNPYDEGGGHYAGFQWGEMGIIVTVIPPRSLRGVRNMKPKRNLTKLV